MEFDAAVTQALNKAHGSDSHNFGHKNYDSLDDAQTERALELAERGTGITDKEFAELNRIMKYNARDSDFSTAFYQGIGGPREALEFYGQMQTTNTRTITKRCGEFRRTNRSQNAGLGSPYPTTPMRSACLRRRRTNWPRESNSPTCPEKTWRKIWRR
ncbi:hypothetical protein ABZ516_11940 [Streptomyces sp. NPDC019826]|uniref:hypothetical protein n=1 Tax=unclassified Streptomyces TaxID=2593676 RepID=UPI0030CF6E5E